MESLLSFGVVGIIAVCVVLPGIILAGGLIFFMVRKQLKSSSNRQNILLTGVTEPAVIISARNNYFTGGGKNQPAAQVNATFEVEVQPAGQPAFRAKITELMSVRDGEPRFPGERSGEAGVKVWVTYDPNNKSRIVLDHYDSNHANAMKRREFEKQDKRNEGIRRAGVEAAAVILEVEDLKLTNIVEKDYLNSTVMRLNLEVTPENAPSYKAEAMAAIANASLGKYTAGKKVIVKYNPQNKTHVALIRSEEG